MEKMNQENEPETGAIVFRNDDFETTPRLYVNDISKGAHLAAKYCECAAYVDVLTAQDTIYASWFAGVPFEKDARAIELSQKVPAYTRPDDGYADDVAILERHGNLGEMLELGFYIAVSNNPASGYPCHLDTRDDADFALRQLEIEGRDICRENQELDARTRILRIDAWLADTECSFLSYRCEFIALSMLLGSCLPHNQVMEFEQELSRLDVT